MKAKRPRWKRVLRGIAIGFASLVALLVLAVAFLHTPWGKRIVRGRIEAKLAAKVNGTVKVGSLDYGFLFGTIHLGDLEIADATGRPAIKVAAIDIDLDRWSVLAKEPLLNKVAVRGLGVTVVKSADGRSNLTGLFKPSNDKPSLARIRVAQLSVDGAATISKPDGTQIAIDDIHVAGSLDARPLAQHVDAALAQLAANVTIAKPGKETKRLAVAIDAVTLARRATSVDAKIERVVAGPLAIGALTAHADLANGKLAGDQLLSITGTRVDHTQLAAFLGRELLREDVTLDLTIDGPADKLVLDGSLRTGETCLNLDGTADLAAARPRYAFTIAGSDLRTTAVITKKKLPDVTSDVKLAFAGSGKALADLEGDLDVAIRALGIDVSGKATIGTDKHLHGTLALATEPARALAAAEAAGIVLPPKLAKLRDKLPPKIELAVTADGRIAGELTLTVAPAKLALANGHVTLAASALLDNKKLRSATAQIELAALDLAALANLAGRAPKAFGTLSGQIGITREPTSTFATVRAQLDTGRRTIALIDARLPLAKLAGKLGLAPTSAWHLGVDVDRRSFADIAPMLPARLRTKLPAGDVAVHVALAGTPAQPTGTLAIAATAAGKQIDLHGTLASTPHGLTLATTGNVALAGDALAKLDATVMLPAPFASGKLDLKALRAGAQVDATIHLPERTLASLGALRPRLGELGQKLGGKLSGTITAKGAPAQLALDAKLRWFGYRTAAGTLGETAVVAYGSPKHLIAKVDHASTLAIVAQIDRSVAGRIAVHASAFAPESPLLPLLPGFIATKLGAHDVGRVRSNLDGTFTLVRSAAGLAISDVDVTGALDITGAALAIPKSGRRYHDVGLTLAADPKGLRITSRAHESDAEDNDRRLEATGLLAFAQKKPSKLDLSLVAHDWLLFGSSKLGPADAPRASADFKIGVAVDLTKPIIGVDATVHSLTLRAPERFDRGHQPEPMMDDVIYLERGQTAGKLPVAPPIVAAAPKQRRPMDIRIHIPKPIRLNQTPFDVMARGELTVTVRDAGVTTRGALKMESGTLYLFGHDHQLVEGSLAFTDDHPHGWLALTFERPLSDAVRRELAATAGTGSRVSFAGAPTKPKASLSGAASSALDGQMAMNNAGRGVYITRPGLPASSSVQAPRGDQLSVMTFLASNLPHLMFLDRISAWSDPYERADAYGRIQHVEAERYTAGDRARVRAVVRPSTPGRSSAELQYDRMLLHTDRAAAGVGVRAGDRGGGGVGLFLEWSSKD